MSFVFNNALDVNKLSIACRERCLILRYCILEWSEKKFFWKSKKVLLSNPGKYQKLVENLLFFGGCPHFPAGHPPKC